MKKLLIFTVVLTFLVYSCKKDDNNTQNQTQTSVSNYTPLTIGNYWVYYNYKIDEFGNDSLISAIDSIVITHDTIIRGYTYYVAEGNWHPYNQWSTRFIARDSAGYMVFADGRVGFSPTNFTDTFNYKVEHFNGNDTLYESFYMMENVAGTLNLPAGPFDSVLNLKGTIIGHHQPPQLPNPRYTDNMWAPRVGQILSNFFYFASNGRIEKRLARYHIN